LLASRFGGASRDHRRFHKIRSRLESRSHNSNPHFVNIRSLLSKNKIIASQFSARDGLPGKDYSTTAGQVNIEIQKIRTASGGISMPT
jgi:hypothetical protein